MAARDPLADVFAKCGGTTFPGIYQLEMEWLRVEPDACSAKMRNEALNNWLWRRSRPSDGGGHVMDGPAWAPIGGYRGLQSFDLLGLWIRDNPDESAKAVRAELAALRLGGPAWGTLGDNEAPYEHEIVY
jgi:hypothetical protein